MLCNTKIIFFVKNAWQNGFYEINDDEIVTGYGTARSGRNRNGFLMSKYENIISQPSDVCDLLIFTYFFSKQHFEKIVVIVIKNIIKSSRYYEKC